MNPIEWSAMQQLAALVWFALAVTTALEVYLRERRDRRDSSGVEW